MPGAFEITVRIAREERGLKSGLIDILNTSLIQPVKHVGRMMVYAERRRLPRYWYWSAP